MTSTPATPPFSPPAPVNAPVRLAPLVLLTLPFLLNDFGNIFVHHVTWWIVQDYAWRALVLGLLWWAVRRGGVPAEPLRWRMPNALTFAAWLLFTTAAGVWLIDGPGRRLLELWPETRFGMVPLILSPGLRWFDLTFGLVLVAVSEEFVFRGVLLPQLSRRLRSEWAGLLISSALFGLVHWSTGAGAVLQTGIAGLLLGLCTLRTRTLYPAVIAHYVINFVTFSPPVSPAN